MKFVAAAALSLSLLALGTAGGAQAAVDPAEMEELFLEARVGRTALSSDVAALWDTEADTVFLSVVELAEALGLSAADQDGTLVGFLRSESDTWRLDPAAGRLTLLDGETVEIGPEQLVELDGAFYLASGLVERIWPVKLNLDTGSMRLEVEALEPIPALETAERKTRWDRLNGRSRPKEPSYPDKTTPARMWSLPGVDFEATAGYEAKEGVLGAYGAVIGGDFLGMSVSGFISGDEESFLQRIRLRGEMRDPGGDLFGLGIGMSSLAVGDVVTPGLPLVVDTVGGLGVNINGLDGTLPTDYTSTRIKGDALAGWDAELYVNGELVSAETVGTTGRYAFDMPLSYGRNLVRVVLYGPQGQRQEVTDTYRIGGQMPRPGEVKWRFGGVLPDSELVPLDDEDDFHLNNRTFLDEPKEDPVAAGVGAVSIGVAPGWSLGAGFGWVPNEDTRSSETDHLFGTANLLGNVLGSSIRLDAVIDQDGGLGAGASLITELAGFSMAFSHAWFQNGFSSPVSGYGNAALASSSEVAISRTFWLGEVLPSIGVSAEYERETTQGGRQFDTAQVRLSTRLGGLSLSNSIGYRWVDDRQDTAGLVAASGRIWDVPVRLAVGYTLSGDSTQSAGVDYLDLSIPRLDLDEDTTFRPRISYSLEDSDFRASANLSRDFGGYRLGVSALYSTEGGVGVALTFGTSFGPDPYQGGVRFSDKSLGSSGSVVASAYLDRDGDGEYDKGDEPLEGVKFAVGGRRYDTETDVQGIARLDGLATHERMPLTVVQGSLGDALYSPQQEGYSVVLRPGMVETIAFPIVEVSEVEGMALNEAGVPAGGAVVRLIGNNDETVSETIVAPDGYFYFGSLKPSTYTVEIGKNRTNVELASGELETLEITVSVAE